MSALGFMALFSVTRRDMGGGGEGERQKKGEGERSKCSQGLMFAPGHPLV